MSRFVNFFIDRPIFASVVSIIMLLAGLLALRELPIAQFPEISPPTVQLSANCPGANAPVMAETVASPIEEQVNGAENMLYLSSTNSNTGQTNLTATFAIGANPSLAQVDVQNRPSLPQPQLPSEVVREGITVRKQSTRFLLLIALTWPDRSRSALFLGILPLVIASGVAGSASRHSLGTSSIGSTDIDLTLSARGLSPSMIVDSSSRLPSPFGWPVVSRRL